MEPKERRAPTSDTFFSLTQNRYRFRNLSKNVHRASVVRALIFPKERSRLCSRLLGSNLQSLWNVMPDRNVFVRLGGHGSFQMVSQCDLGGGGRMGVTRYQLETENSHRGSQPCRCDRGLIRALDTRAWMRCPGGQYSVCNVTHHYEKKWHCPSLHWERTTPALCLELSWTLHYAPLPLADLSLHPSTIINRNWQWNGAR